MKKPTAGHVCNMWYRQINILRAPSEQCAEPGGHRAVIVAPARRHRAIALLLLCRDVRHVTLLCRSGDLGLVVSICQQYSQINTAFVI